MSSFQYEKKQQVQHKIEISNVGKNKTKCVWGKQQQNEEMRCCKKRWRVPLSSGDWLKHWCGSIHHSSQGCLFFLGDKKRWGFRGRFWRLRDQGWSLSPRPCPRPRPLDAFLWSGERSSNEGGRVGKGRIPLDRVGQTPPKSRAWREIESGDNTADTSLEAEMVNGHTWKLVTLIAWISLSKT